MTPHDNATKRGGQGGDKQAMITTRNCAGDGAAGITTEAVRDQPLPVEQNLRRRVRRVGSRSLAVRITWRGVGTVSVSGAAWWRPRNVTRRLLRQKLSSRSRLQQVTCRRRRIAPLRSSRAFAIHACPVAPVMARAAGGPV